MDASTSRAVKRLGRIAAVLAALPVVGAEEYANGRLRAKPIVSRHFTAGNQQRYGWAPLSRDYYRAKARGIVKRGGRAVLGDGMPGVKLDTNAEFQSSTGELVGIGSGTNLPMLVRKGKLRQAVLSRTHRILAAGDVAVAVFGNLPVYALAHHRGSGRLPKRSPVEPNAEDRGEVVKVMQRQLDVAIGTGGDLPIDARSIPGRARVG